MPKKPTLHIERLSRGFAVVDNETGWVWRTLDTYAQAEAWIEEAS